MEVLDTTYLNLLSWNPIETSGSNVDAVKMEPLLTHPPAGTSDTAREKQIMDRSNSLRVYHRAKALDSKREKSILKAMFKNKNKLEQEPMPIQGSSNGKLQKTQPSKLGKDQGPEVPVFRS